MDAKNLEKYSAAFTLSDMEVFLFPELMYALVLANIMSPRIWKWREDPWFEGIGGMGFNRQIQRLKQYIMDHYSFNLDLETWGVTTKQRELERFAAFVDPEIFSRSNALFGYEGDAIYFDMDIRRHFGLDRYTDDVIPYWKTETVEAMDAFRHKPGYTAGAGECVSLAALYAAALYIVLEVPLEKIFMMATPLHSQNFVALGEGVITNNRRIVTKNMWFNGTMLSTKARRALEHERVTIIGHCSGYAHIDYAEATIDPAAYHAFLGQLQDYLSTEITFEIFINFLRVCNQYQKYFQFELTLGGKQCFLDAERLFRYEHGSNHRVGDASRKKLLMEVESEEFDLQPDPQRHALQIIEEMLNHKPLACCAGVVDKEWREALPHIPDWDGFCRDLKNFTCITPRVPMEDKQFVASPAVQLESKMTREAVVTYLQSLRRDSTTVDLAFYAGRQVDEKGWQPFLKACFERNPVCLEFFKGQSLAAVYQTLQSWPDASIYDGGGLATPDEVVNYRHGDGVEKALTFIHCARARQVRLQWAYQADAKSLQLTAEGALVAFSLRREIAFLAADPGLWQLAAEPGKLIDSASAADVQ